MAKVHYMTGAIFARGPRVGIQKQRHSARCGTTGGKAALVTDKPEETTCRRCLRFIDRARAGGLIP